MIIPANGRLYLLGFFALGLALPRAPALLNIDGSRNQLFVFGSVAVGYNSNVFSDASSRGDYTITADAGVELKRRAGIIAVNATAKVNYVHYGKYSDESAINPNFYLEFNKTTGRTTGAITINAYRESRSDSAVNLRTNSWNIPIGLSLKYPINDKFYAVSSTSYLQRRYTDSPTPLANYTDYTEGLDLFYIYTSKLDLVGGYRIRVSQTSLGSDTTDHWFSLGATGGLFAKLNGSIRLGYQIRDTGGSGGESFSHLNASGSLNWPFSRKLGLSGLISRDFNTIATGASIDSASVALRATYAFTRKFVFGSGVAYGRNEFLGHNQPARTDDFFSFDVNARYTMNEHLSLGASYTYFSNSSILRFSEFDRQGFSFDIASRY